MEEGNKSKQKIKTSTNLSDEASEDEKPGSANRGLEEQSSLADSFPYNGEAMSVSSLPSQQHQQQHQQFHPFHTGESHYQIFSHHSYGQSQPQLQYYHSQQGIMQPSFQEDSQSLDSSQQHYSQHPQQELSQAQSSPLRSNYFSTPRNDSTIHVAAGKSPTENVSYFSTIQHSFSLLNTNI
jgi:hypothetical protein